VRERLEDGRCREEILHESSAAEFRERVWNGWMRGRQLLQRAAADLEGFGWDRCHDGGGAGRACEKRHFAEQRAPRERREGLLARRRVLADLRTPGDEDEK
jgi:hypothetical protein